MMNMADGTDMATWFIQGGIPPLVLVHSGHGTLSLHERRGFRADPLLQSIMRLERRHLDAVDGRAGFPDLADFFFAHLANPHDPVPLQPATGEIDGTLTQWLVQVTALYEHE